MATLVRRASVAVRPAPTVTGPVPERGTGAGALRGASDLVRVVHRGASCCVRVAVLRAPTGDSPRLIPATARRHAWEGSLAPAAPTRPQALGFARAGGTRIIPGGSAPRPAPSA